MEEEEEKRRGRREGRGERGISRDRSSYQILILSTD